MEPFKSTGDAAEITLEGELISVKLADGQTFSFPHLSFPASFLEWQSQARLQMFQRMRNAGAEAIRAQPAHLPVLATLGKGNFPVNLTSRGIGLLPKTDALEKYTRLLTVTREENDDKVNEESLPARVGAMSQFYNHSEDVDPMMLGGLEIFEGRTPENIRNNPMVSLLYTGEPPRFPSYQFNGVMEFLTPEDERFKFLLAARELFAFDAFHVTQNRYPFGYAFHLVEILDKTPFSRR